MAHILFVQSSSTIDTMDTVPYAVRMNRIYSVCIIDRRHGSHGLLAPKLMLVVTMTTTNMMMMNFITARKIIVLILVVKTIMANNAKLYTKWKNTTWKNFEENIRRGRSRSEGLTRDG